MKYDFSELLKNYRIKYEITQQEAAKRIGISQPTVVKIENGGEPTVPGNRKFRRLLWQCSSHQMNHRHHPHNKA